MSKHLAFSIAALSLFISSAAVAQARSGAPPLNAALEKAAAVMLEAKVPGQLLLTDATGDVQTRAFGQADRERKLRNKVGQTWLWASVSKQVTAILVMQEVDRGKIELDAPVGLYLPAFAGDHAITIRELLQHRSGLPNPSDTVEVNDVPSFYQETGPGISISARTLGFCSGPAKAKRGERWEYNNCDYLVLGAVLEAVSGRSYSQLIRERLARPLRLASLRVAADGTARGGAAAEGYYEGKPLTRFFNVATAGPAAALVGTARDLAAIDRALMNGSLLSEAARAEAWNGDPKQGYQALGVWSFSSPLKGCDGVVRLVERRGDYAGTQVRNIIAPDLQRALVLFTNDASVQFGEIWQGKGLMHDVLAAAFCTQIES